MPPRTLFDRAEFGELTRTAVDDELRPMLRLFTSANSERVAAVCIDVGLAETRASPLRSSWSMRTMYIEQRRAWAPWDC